MKKSISFLMIALLAILPLATLKVEAQQNSVPKIEFEKYTLSNGLQVILHVDRKLPIVHVLIQKKAQFSHDQPLL